MEDERCQNTDECQLKQGLGKEKCARTCLSKSCSVIIAGHIPPIVTPYNGQLQWNSTKLISKYALILNKWEFFFVPERQLMAKLQDFQRTGLSKEECIISNFLI